MNDTLTEAEAALILAWIDAGLISPAWVCLLP
jgi:hypothetical protein